MMRKILCLLFIIPSVHLFMGLHMWLYVNYVRKRTVYICGYVYIVYTYVAMCLLCIYVCGYVFIMYIRMWLCVYYVYTYVAMCLLCIYVCGYVFIMYIHMWLCVYYVYTYVAIHILRFVAMCMFLLKFMYG